MDQDSLRPRRPHMETVIATNQMIVATAQMLNGFANTCEHKMLHLHHKVRRVATERALGCTSGLHIA